MKRLLTASFLAACLASPVVAVPVQWAGNGHWYDYVSTNTDWNSASALAAGSVYSGMNGYLATITSAAEQTFLDTINSHIAWLGGSDAAVEGAWEWVTEPGGPVAFTYTNWSGGEPNNCCFGENYAVGWWNGDTWNDLAANDTYNAGYVVEYSPSAVPLPAGLPLMLVGLGGLALLRRRKV